MSLVNIQLIVWLVPIVPLMLLVRSLISKLNPRRGRIALGVAALWPLWLVLAAVFLLADLIELILGPVIRWFKSDPRRDTTEAFLRSGNTRSDPPPRPRR